MGAKIGGSKGPQADINVTPLVDIVLVLLIIFMVITPLLAKNIPVEVPMKAEMEEPPEQMKEQVVVKLFVDQHIEVNTEEVALEGLEAVIADAMTGRSFEDKVVFFEAEDDAPYGLAVAVLDAVKGVGGVTLGMMTPRKDEPGDPEGGGEPGAGAEGAVAPAATPL
jgi:biopolymer transport protein ExbD